MVIKLIDYIKVGFTNQDGQIIFEKIMNAFRNKEKVGISFEGMGGVSSSFVNNAFIQLLDHYEYSFINDKNKHKCTDTFTYNYNCNIYSIVIL